jgi:Protein of unknown function (DUF3237)
MMTAFVQSSQRRREAMPGLSFIELPEAQKSVHLKPLFVMHLDVTGPLSFGQTPAGDRRVGIITGGRFEGDRLSGLVLDGGADWQVLRPDGVTTLDVRLILKTSDGAFIGMTYKGLRHGPPPVMAELAKGNEVDPASYYFRINPMFETASPHYAWINRSLALGIGHRHADGPVYSIFEVL